MFENLTFDTQLRAFAFLFILCTMVLWELLWPRRSEVTRPRRWGANFGVFGINVVMLLALPVSAVGAAIISIQYTFGLFYWVEVAFWPKIIITLLLLDCLIYWQHRMFHMFAPLWRIHRMHHTDTAIDVTTALRFHPVEILLSIVIKAIVIILLGAPLFAVIAFEIILNGAAMFNHSNVAMPRWVDRIVRAIIVTPDMHRVHHSVLPDEHHFNYGFALSVWDRLFRSYVAAPRAGHLAMKIGLDYFNKVQEMRLDKLLTQPFRAKK